MTPTGLEGATIVVTGAASGQGLDQAVLLAESGATVFATDVSTRPPVGLRAAQIHYRVLDVTDGAAWAQLAGDLADVLGHVRLRGLVNNAGITNRAGIGSVSRADWDRVLSVNLTGPMLGIQALSGLMGAGSSIVNVGSTAALTGHYPAAYTASKWGLRGLTHVAAGELGSRGIRVNVVHPGYIETPMTATAPPAMREAHLELTPLERVGVAREVATVVAFLLSDGAAYVSGAEIPIDGGFVSAGGTKIIADRIAGKSAD